MFAYLLGYKALTKQGIDKDRYRYETDPGMRMSAFPLQLIHTQKVSAAVPRKGMRDGFSIYKE